MIWAALATCSSTAGPVAPLPDAPSGPSAASVAAAAPEGGGGGAGQVGTGGGGFASAAAFTVDDEAMLRRRLGKLPFDDERAVLRFLEAYGAACPPQSKEIAERFAGRLAAALRSDVVAVRRGAAAALGRIEPGFVKGDPFTSLFVDADATVRREAVLGRARHGIGMLWIQVAAMTRDPEARVRAAAAEALGAVQHADVTARLCELLADPEQEVVAATGRALERSLAGDPPKAVLDGCASERVEVRLASARVLAALRGAKAAEVLTPMVDDANWQVRREAMRGLAGIDGEPGEKAAWALLAAAEHDGRSRTDRLEAIQALASTPRRPDVERLARLADTTKDPVLLLGVSRTLLAWNDLRGLDVLVALTERTTEDPIERKSVARVRSVAAETIDEALASRGEAPRKLAGGAVVHSRTWRDKLPEIKACLAKKGLDYSPSRLDDTVW